MNKFGWTALFALTLLNTVGVVYVHSRMPDASQMEHVARQAVEKREAEFLEHMRPGLNRIQKDFDRPVTSPKTVEELIREYSSMVN